MFAPPPVQLSRAQIQARLEVKNNADSNDPPARTELASLHPNDLRSPISPKRSLRFIRGGRAERPKVSAPLTAPPKGPPPPIPPGLRAELPRRGSKDKDTPDALKSSFGENPRRAPVPPKRPSRALVEPLYSTSPDSLPAPNRPIPDIPAQDVPPPIPAKSPRRQMMADGRNVDAVVATQQSRLEDLPLSATVASTQRDTAVKSAPDRPHHPPRSSTAPVMSIIREPSQVKPVNGQDKRMRSAHATFVMADMGTMPRNRGSARLSEVRGEKIDKYASHKRHKSTTPPIVSALQDLDDLKLFNRTAAAPRRATEGDINLTRSGTPPEAQSPWKRRRKGETMSMLLETGFFPVESFVYNKHNPNVSVRVNPPLPLSGMDKALPPTPGSILATPTEMYATPARNRKQSDKKRRPLGQLSTTDAKANSSVDVESLLSPRSRLSAIPECAQSWETSPIPSGTTTPIATQIHLKGGSVLTVSPPELTAWQRAIYIQGPIKLPKPTIIPRKNSVASLEPFQEMVDQVYQEALSVPRRCSDDAVEEDVCDFFDEFRFEEINFAGDLLAVEGVQLGDIKESDEEVVHELERFSTPPGEPPASPVEKIMAQEIAESLPKPPPVENEETLRARGIARLKHNAGPTSPTSSSRRKDSMTLDTDVLSLLPTPEDSMLAAVLEPSRASIESSRANSGSGKIEEVDELDSHSAWIAHATIPRRGDLNRDPSVKHSYNPLKRMQRLVATAGAIL